MVDNTSKMRKCWRKMYLAFVLAATATDSDSHQRFYVLFLMWNNIFIRHMDKYINNGGVYTMELANSFDADSLDLPFTILNHDF